MSTFARSASRELSVDDTAGMQFLAFESSGDTDLVVRVALPPARGGGRPRSALIELGAAAWCSMEQPAPSDEIASGPVNFVPGADADELSGSWGRVLFESGTARLRELDDVGFELDPAARDAWARLVHESSAPPEVIELLVSQGLADTVDGTFVLTDAGRDMVAACLAPHPAVTLVRSESGTEASHAVYGGASVWVAVSSESIDGAVHVVGFDPADGPARVAALAGLFRTASDPEFTPELAWDADEAPEHARVHCNIRWSADDGTVSGGELLWADAGPSGVALLEWDDEGVDETADPGVRSLVAHPSTRDVVLDLILSYLPPPVGSGVAPDVAT